MAEFEASGTGSDVGAQALEADLRGLQAGMAAFRREIEGTGQALRGTGRSAEGMARSIGQAVRSAFDGLIGGTQSLGHALAGIGRAVSAGVLNQAMAPIQGALTAGIGSGLRAILPFRDGAPFLSGRVEAFAAGGIVDRPVHFPMRGGQTGLMGEAGPEAIMPLARGPDGRLGVRMAGAGAGPVVRVQMHVSTPDLAGFQRSQGQVAAQLVRAIRRGGRNL